MKYKTVIIIAFLLAPAVLWAGNFPSVTLISPAGTGFVPYTSFGLVFKKGEAPENYSLKPVANGKSEHLFQLNPLARYEDGSLKHAIAHLKVDASAMEANPKIEFKLTDVDSQKTAVVDFPNKNKLLISLHMEGKRYEASWNGEKKPKGCVVRYSGPLATEKRCALLLLNENGRPHPHLSVVLNTREYEAAKATKFDLSFENTFSYVPNPRGYEYQVKIYLNNKLKYESKKIGHTHHSRWRKTFWDTSGNEVLVKDDVNYLLSTNIVPNYDKEIRVSNRALRDLPLSIDPMEIGLFTSYMPQTGAQATIGPLPHYAAIYLLTGDLNGKRSVLEHGNAGGTYQIHYKNQKTGLPITLDDFPYLTLDANDTDTRNPKTGKPEAFPKVENGLEKHKPDDAHQPSIAFLPYILTGDAYYLDELHYWANYNVIKAHPGYREYEKGLLKWGQVRAQAWSLRTLAHAAFITPDTHPLKQYFTQILNNNIDYYNNTYGGSKNELGIVTTRIPRPWMDDYLTWSAGYVYQLGYKNILPFFKYKARFPLLRMSPPFCWLSASVYEDKIFDSDGEIFTKASQYIKSNNSPSCVGYEMSGYPKDGMGYAAFLQPALAIIHDINIPGADKAWDLYQKRSPKQDYSRFPQFAIVPLKKEGKEVGVQNMSLEKKEVKDKTGTKESFIKIKLNFKAKVFAEIQTKNEKKKLECPLGSYEKGEHTLTFGKIKTCIEQKNIKTPVTVRLKSLDSFKHSEYISESFDYK